MTNPIFVLLGSSPDTNAGNGQKRTQAQCAKGLHTALKVLCSVHFTASWTGEIKQHSTGYYFETFPAHTRRQCGYSKMAQLITLTEHAGTRHVNSFVTLTGG
jgi:hypothetical protein